MTIRALLEMVERDDLVLPAMQRPFVWQEDRILRLMDSLMRLFPIGTVLIWETDEVQRYRAFAKNAVSKEQPRWNFSQADSGKRLKYVLDGQQRLTSLNIACFGTLDGRKLYLDVLSGDPDNKDPGEMYYDFKFLSGTEVSTRNGPVIQGEIGPYFVPFERFRQVDPVHSMVQASKLSQELKLEDNLATRLVENFSRAVNVLVSGQPLQVHVVDEHGQSQTPIAEILELFVRVNSSGLALQRSDLLMSLLDLSWNDVQPVLLRVADSASQNAPVQLTRDLILKSVLLYIGEESRFDRLVKDRDRIERIAPGLKDSLPKIEKAWLKLGVLLRQNCRIHSPRFFRQATNALLPFVVWLADHPKVSQAEENTLVAALHIALMSGVFGGAEARMGAFARNECRGASAFPIKKLARLVRATRPITDLDAMLGHHLDLTLNIAQGGVVLDGNPDELERDHIFPKARLAADGVADARINAYANFHFLRQTDNRNKTDRPPHEWFKQPGESAPAYTDQDMEDRLLTWELIQPGAFDRLLEIRGAKIREAACKLFHLQESDFNALFEE